MREGWECRVSVTARLLRLPKGCWKGKIDLFETAIGCILDGVYDRSG